MTSKKILYLDLETTGLYPEAGHTILSIGAVVDRKTKKDPIKEFYIEIMPNDAHWNAASPAALKVNGFTYEYLLTHGVPINKAITDFTAWLSENGVTAGKAIVVGNNPAFDYKFLMAAMRGPLEFVNFPTSAEDVYDIKDLYSILVNRRVMPFIPQSLGGRSGKNMAERLGVEPEPVVHIALEGARLDRRMYERCMELLQAQEA